MVSYDQTNAQCFVDLMDEVSKPFFLATRLVMFIDDDLVYPLDLATS